MKNNLEVLPRLLQVTQWDNQTPIPEVFFGKSLPELTSVLYESLPNVRLALIGFWATYDQIPLDPNTVSKMSQGKQNLDIDMFIPVIPTDEDYWQSAVEDNLEVTLVGGNKDIVICQGHIFLSPEISDKDPEFLKLMVHRSLMAHLTPQDSYEKVGRTGEPLTVIGKDVKDWGAIRRDQPEEDQHIYIEAMPLFVTTTGQSELERQLEDVGISQDLTPVLCVARKKDNHLPDLKLLDPDCKHYQFTGLPPLNLDYIKSSPTNALNFLRREVKAIALYAQFASDHPDHIRFTQNQLNLLHQHVEYIEYFEHGIKGYPELISKINESFSRVADILQTRFGLHTPKTILSQPQNPQSH